jgi:hypothetical protein
MKNINNITLSENFPIQIVNRRNIGQIDTHNKHINIGQIDTHNKHINIGQIDTHDKHIHDGIILYSQQILPL